MDKINKQEIFEKELLPHMAALKTFAFNLTLDDGYAEDLVQEAFIKAFKSIEHYKSGTNAKAWLFTILKNAYINEYRRKSSQPNRVDFQDIVGLKDNESLLHHGTNDLSKEFFDHKMGDEVTIAINSLPIDFRAIIILCDIEGFTYDEISQIMDIPLGTVRSRLFRARNMLKDLLMEYAKKRSYKDLRGLRRVKSDED